MTPRSLFSGIRTIATPVLAAGLMTGYTSCNACSWLIVQCRQKASYVSYSLTVPEIAALRFVDKQGNVILEPAMNRPEIKEFADDLRYLVKIADSVEYAGGKLHLREEETIALYVDLVDTEGTAFRRFPLEKESDDVNILYYLPPGKFRGLGIPLEIGLSESEITLLRPYFAR